MENRIEIVENILSANDKLANSNRQLLNQNHVFGINLMASPGAGKTSLIEITLSSLPSNLKISVIDGDVATSIDTDRALKAGASQAVQINTGGSCHLDAVMLNRALEHMNLENTDLLLVENVGNLICPASFKLGTHKSILIASVPEGDDKPYKYPGMYQGVDAVVINKIDLLPYIKYDIDYFKRGVEILNPDITFFPVSCYTGEGIDIWIDWLIENIDNFKTSNLN